jgi:hypothetical protein
MAKLKVGDTVTLKELSLATEGFVVGEKVTVEDISTAPGELNIEISNEAGEVGFVAVQHLDVDPSAVTDLREFMDSIRYGKIESEKGLVAVLGTMMLLEAHGDVNSYTDFREGDLVEIEWIDQRASEKFNVKPGDHAYCLCAAGGGNGMFTDGKEVFAAKAKLALSATEHPVDERRLP